MSLVLLLGAGFGLGATLVWYGLWPPRPALTTALARLAPVAAPNAARASRLPRRYRWLAAPWHRLGLPTGHTRTDLALLGRHPSTVLAAQTVTTAVGAVVPPLVAHGWGIGGTVPLWLALLGGFVGYRWHHTRLRRAAQRRRGELRTTLSVVQDLVTCALAGGAGTDQALQEATSICHGPAAAQLRDTLDRARLVRQPAWQALAAFGDRTRVRELVEFANALKLAEHEGTRIRTSVQAYAATSRARETAQMETEARAAGVRMALPVLLLALAYGVWLLYPALARMQQGLSI